MRYEGRAAIVRRLAYLLRYTQGRKYMPSVREMARGLGVCERTVIRDLNALEEAGWPLPKRWDCGRIELSAPRGDSLSSPAVSTGRSCGATATAARNVGGR